MLGLKLSRWLRNNRGNVSIIFAFSIIPMIFLTGMGFDYANAALREEQLNAAADAAALAALTPGLLTQDDAAATNAAMTTFMAQANVVDGVTIKQSDVNITVSDSATTRTVQVDYKAESQNFFPAVLSSSFIALAGTSQANAQYAPNIDFYLLLDSSPSMAIAATPDGIQKMVANTGSQGGCGFACHETYPAGDGLAIDNYQLSLNLGVTLRIDLLRQATENLMTTAQNAAVNDKANYRMAIYTFDYGFNTIQPLTSSLTAAQNAAATIKSLVVYDNSCLTQWNCNNDQDTDFDNAMNNINFVMPNPGNGTSIQGDTPQEVLFLVTDGVDDANINGNRTMIAMNSGKTNWCSKVKARGIRIAVLYTVYLPLPTNSFYMSNISSWQPTIGPTLQSCASPGLYFLVDSGGDISSALTALFETAIQTAHLSL